MSELSFLSAPGLEGRPPSFVQHNEAYAFRGFDVDVGRRELRRHGELVEIGGRAFDLLTVLLQGRGTVVGKRRIMEEVWPSTIVDDSNLRFQMACLRRALCPHGDIVKTVQGRGYLLVADGVIATGGAPAPAFSQDPWGLPGDDEGPATIAVIDDDEAMREALDGLLRSTGYAAYSFASTKAFVDSHAVGKVDCLLLDVWLPGQNGLDFQADLQAAGVDVPIIFMSGHADIPMTVRAMKHGAVEFLTKPVRHEELLGAVGGAVRARRGLASAT